MKSSKRAPEDDIKNMASLTAPRRSSGDGEEGKALVAASSPLPEDAFVTKLATAEKESTGGSDDNDAKKVAKYNPPAEVLKSGSAAVDAELAKKQAASSTALIRDKQQQAALQVLAGVRELDDSSGALLDEKDGIVPIAAWQRSDHVSPGAVAVGGFHLHPSLTPSLNADLAAFSMPPVDESVAEAVAPSSFVVANVVTDDDIRRQYLSDVRDEILGSAVEAKAVKDEKKHHFWLWGCLVAAIVIVVVVPTVAVTQTRKNQSSTQQAQAFPTPAPTLSRAQNCAMMTELLRNNTNLTTALLLLNQSAAVSVSCDQYNNETCIRDVVGADATKANATCSLLGGTLVEEDFTIMCNSATQNRTLVANFVHDSVCVAASCNTSEIEYYLGEQITTQKQLLLMENEGYQYCQVLYGTYTKPSNSQQQIQYLPSIWGEQCAMENDNITNNIKLSQLYNTDILPSCQRNGSDATCTVDFGFAAIQIEPWCTHIRGQYHELDFQLQCTSLNGGVYAIQHLHQPVCAGVSCNVSQVDGYTVELFRSGLMVKQGYQNCQILANNSIFENATDHECAVATANSTSYSNLAPLYASASALTPSCQACPSKSSVAALLGDASTSETVAPSCQVCTYDFFTLFLEARKLCSDSFFEEDFTIQCDSSIENGGIYIYNFFNYFVCLGLNCDTSEIESYLEGPIVSQIQILENGGHVQNCRVVYESYVNGQGLTQYLPSVWGEQCAVESNAIFSNYELAALIYTVLVPTCQLHERQANCTTDYIGENTQVEALCQSLGGKYFEFDFAFACFSQAGFANFTLEYLHVPQCTGINCNLSQSAADALQFYSKYLEDYQGLQHCELLSQDKPRQNASVQQQNVSGGECALATNILYTNPQWAQLNTDSSNVSPGCFFNGNKVNCTYDQGSYVSQGMTLCKDLGGRFAEVNFTIANCFQSGDIYTNNYVNDFFCFGLSCNVSQTQSYLEGVVLLNVLQNNCSQVLATHDSRF